MTSAKIVGRGSRSSCPENIYAVDAEVYDSTGRIVGRCTLMPRIDPGVSLATNDLDTWGESIDCWADARLIAWISIDVGANERIASIVHAVRRAFDRDTTSWPLLDAVKYARRALRSADADTPPANVDLLTYAGDGLLGEVERVGHYGAVDILRSAMAAERYARGHRKPTPQPEVRTFEVWSGKARPLCPIAPDGDQTTNYEQAERAAQAHADRMRVPVWIVEILADGTRGPEADLVEPTPPQERA